MVKLHQVTAGYGSPVLKNITTTFPPGQVTVILGPNGCGKSTLLRCAAGLLPALSGEISIPEPRARMVSYLPQSRSVPELTAGRLVLHGRFPWLGYPRRYRNADRLAAQAAMERLGISEFAETPLPQLSGGTRQKCYLAMALCQDAPTILLDEPASFLDIGHQLKLLTLCRELADEGRAVVLVLHDIAAALRYGDQILLMESGELRCAGTPEEMIASGELERVFGVSIHKTQFDGHTHYICQL